MKLSFLGATGTVTGSKYLIEQDGKRVLIDCGLYQGHKELRLRNWADLPIEPASIDWVVLTHAHIDHSGYIPLLVKNGFRGKIFCSEATFDLCKILLPDSGHIHEEDAKRANLYGYTKHSPALPLYTEEGAQESLKYFHAVPFGKPHYLNSELHFTLSRAGHILGAACVALSNDTDTITFSGDLGRYEDPIMQAPASLQYTDYLVVESTYGDRLHDKSSPLDKMADIINYCAKKGGTVLIPAFAVGRAQLILYYLFELKKQELIPDIPVYLDSPMAIDATELMKKYKNEHKLKEHLCQEVCSIAKYVKTVDESKLINASPMPSIIISASGMATGGRVLHHLKVYLGSSHNCVLFTGFQAGGTRGDRILNGEQSIKIHGEMHAVKAKIETLTNASAHADYEEVLRWLENFKSPPKKVFITHGEKEAAISLKAKIEDKFGWNVVVPTYLDQVEL